MPAAIIVGPGTAWVMLTGSYWQSEGDDPFAVFARWTSFFAFILVVLGLAALLTPRRSELAGYRRARGLCVRCGYRLGADGVERCPECGVSQG